MTCTVDELTPADVDAMLGVDLEIINLATDSDVAAIYAELVEVVLVDPRYHRKRAIVVKRLTNATVPIKPRFGVSQCGHTIHADLNAAANIRDRAAVRRPMVSNLRVEAQAHVL